MEKLITKVSKYLSFILRHKPESIGLALDKNGWVSINELIAKTKKIELSRELINIVVETNDKQRFAIEDSTGKIRANQGHSIDVDLSLSPITPPDTLLHGTAERFIDSIMEQGLSKRNRHHVHLSENEVVAKSVGSRYGKPVLLEVNTKEMCKAGFVFFRTLNNVWLVEKVPAIYITVKKS